MESWFFWFDNEAQNLLKLAHRLENLSRPLEAGSGSDSDNGTVPGTVATMVTPLYFPRSRHTTGVTVLLSFILCAIVVLTVLGNSFVVVAICVEKCLRKPQNYLILSLACADLAIGVAVLPLSALYELTNQWSFGATICEAWIFVDVAACSASILHLVAIALDRYRAITDIHYSQQRRPQQMGVMIAIIWLTSIIIGAAPFSGWTDDNYYERIQNKICLISQDPGYQVFSTTIAFYAPLVTIVMVYYWIYKATKRRIYVRHCATAKFPRDGSKAKLLVPKLLPPPLSIIDISDNCEPEQTVELLAVGDLPSSKKPSTASSIGSSVSMLGSRHLRSGGGAGSPPEATDGEDECSQTGLDSASCVPILFCGGGRRKFTAEQKKERRAFRTVAIVTGTFLVCWLPFFVVALVRPLCGDSCYINSTLASFFGWLGWSNSLVNPVIYTVFSPDFRNAFRKLLLRLVRPCYRLLGMDTEKQQSSSPPE